jgi:hypothetical protein
MKKIVVLFFVLFSGSLFAQTELPVSSQFVNSQDLVEKVFVHVGKAFGSDLVAKLRQAQVQVGKEVSVMHAVVSMPAGSQNPGKWYIDCWFIDSSNSALSLLNTGAIELANSPAGNQIDPSVSNAFARYLKIAQGVDFSGYQFLVKGTVVYPVSFIFHFPGGSQMSYNYAITADNKYCMQMNGY